MMLRFNNLFLNNKRTNLFTAFQTKEHLMNIKIDCVLRNVINASIKQLKVQLNYSFNCGHFVFLFDS